MSVLRNLESRIADLVEGTFGRVFRTQVRPVEIARKLAREMDEHRTVSVSRTYVPNEYVVWLGPDDRARFEGVEHEVADELGAYLLEHARRERLALVGPPPCPSMPAASAWRSSAAPRSSSAPTRHCAWASSASRRDSSALPPGSP